MTSVLSLHEVSKRFPGVKALDGVSLDLVPGSVTALIGENGAGKSTIVKILTGIYRPDDGEVRIGGEIARLHSPRDAWAAGVAAIHQETVMFDELSVAENVFMGHMPGGVLIDPKDMRDRTAALLARIEADFDPGTQVKRLSVAQKHMVEIARALSHDARVVIMDEPTAALSRHEIDELFKLVDSLRSEGRAILFISHKFDEIFGVSDRWVCLRDGKKVGEGLTAETTEPELVRLMVGRPVEQIYPKRDITPGPVVLEVEGLTNDTEFADISFELRRGEILGFYGLVGSGRSEAMQCLFGLTPPIAGRVLLDGAEISITEPAEAIAAGMAYVPEDRQEQGLALPLGVRENITIASLRDHVKRIFLSRRSETEATETLGTRLSIRAAGWESPVNELSGGNQQKVVISKWLATRPKVVILDEPTKGIDVGSKAAVHDFIGELAEEGLAVILVTSELPEALGLSDRLIVMHEGRIAETFTRGNWSPEAVVAMATGARSDAA